MISYALSHAEHGGFHGNCIKKKIKIRRILTLIEMKIILNLVENDICGAFLVNNNIRSDCLLHSLFKRQDFHIKLRCLSQSHNKDTRNQKIFFIFLRAVTIYKKFKHPPPLNESCDIHLGQAINNNGDKEKNRYTVKFDRFFHNSCLISFKPLKIKSLHVTSYLIIFIRLLDFLQTPLSIYPYTPCEACVTGVLVPPAFLYPHHIQLVSLAYILTYLRIACVTGLPTYITYCLFLWRTYL